MKKFFSKEVKIAITVLVSLACLFWGINYLKGINLFTPVNFYYAHFEKVDGLTDSAPVTINGFQVGLVREIVYEYETGKLRVQLSLDKDLKIPVNSEAVIVTDMLGTAQIALNLAKNPQYYEVGADIVGKNQVGLMENVSNELLPSVAAIMPKIDSILTSLNQVVGNPALVKSIDVDSRSESFWSSDKTIHERIEDICGDSLLLKIKKYIYKLIQTPQIFYNE